jgi:LysM repeat protein
MDDGRTEPFEPYQPETSYEWDYEEEPPQGGRPKILWGRIIAIAIVVLIAFLIGRATAGGGVSQDAYDLLKRKNASLEQQLNDARAAANNAQTPPVDNTASPAASESPAGDTKSYVVKPGDTLRGIAEKFYGDPALDDYIAEANGIEGSIIHAGDELTIPPKP